MSAAIDVRLFYPSHQWQDIFHSGGAPVLSQAEIDAVRFQALMAGIRGGKTVAGSNRFLERIIAGPSNGIYLISGPDMPQMKRTTIETVLHGMGPMKLGKWPDALIKPQTTADGKIDGNGIMHMTFGPRVWFKGAKDPNQLRGPALDGWWLDEVTYAPEASFNVLLGRVLDTGGWGMVTGTPKGKNWFYQRTFMQAVERVPGRVYTLDPTGKGRLPTWLLVRYPTGDNPGINEEALEDLAGQYTGKFAQQELDAEFVDWSGAVFQGWALDAAAMRHRQHTFGHVVEGHRYAIGFDPACKGEDWHVSVVVCERCREVVDMWREQRPSFERMFQAQEELMEKWAPKWFTYDETAMGGQMVGEQLEDRLQKIARDQRLANRRRGAFELEGWVFGAKSKTEMLSHAALITEAGFSIPQDVDALAPLRNELRAYEWEDDDLTKDCVMAYGLSLKQFPQPRVRKGAGAPAVLVRNLGKGRDGRGGQDDPGREDMGYREAA